MKRIKSYLFLAVSATAVLCACDRVKENESNFTNVVYLQNALNSNMDKISFRATDFSAERVIRAALALPVETDVNIKVEIDLSLVDVYSKAYGVECTAPEEHIYELEGNNLFIPAGDVLSTEVGLSFSSLPDIPFGEIKVLPVTLKSNDAGIDILNGSKTIYFVLQKGAIIITAAYINDNYLTVPGFEGAGGSAVSGLTQLTMEGLIRPHTLERQLNTFMGIEGYFLIRFGDSGYAPDQIQIADNNYLGGNFPSAAVSPKLPVGGWVHVAVTLDLENAREYKIYYNGELKATGTCGGSMMAVDLSGASSSNKFYIGYSYDKGRELDADVTEYRIWNVVRTQEEIQDNFYEVAPDSPGLVAYWKFDEGNGNIVADHSGNGNNALANSTLKWVPVSLPEEE